MLKSRLSFSYCESCIIGGINVGAKQSFLLFFIIDVFIIFSSVLISYLLRFEGNIPTMYLNSIYYTVILVECTTLTLFYFYKVYRRIWQYASITDIILVVKIITFSLFIDFITLFDDHKNPIHHSYSRLYFHFIMDDHKYRNLQLPTCIEIFT